MCLKEIIVFKKKKIMKFVLNCRGGLSDAGFALAQYMHSQGKSTSEIALALHTSWKTVARNLRLRSVPSGRVSGRSAKHLHPMRQHKKMLRRRFLVNKIARCVVQHVGPAPQCWISLRKRYHSTSAIARELGESHNVHVSPSTIRRDLIALGMRARVRPKGPRRKALDNESRLAFCRANLDLPEGMLLFTDEKYSDSDDHGARFEWCAPGENPSHQSREQYKTKVHVWGAIGIGFKKLVVLPSEPLTAEMYVRCCLRSVKAQLEQGVVLVHDGARPHQSWYTSQWLERFGYAVAADWPPRSPDLNPIENLWALLAQRVSAWFPTTKEDLSAAVAAEWDRIPQCVVNTYVSSFNSRLLRCIAAKGATIITRFRGREQ